MALWVIFDDKILDATGDDMLMIKSAIKGGFFSFNWSTYAAFDLQANTKSNINH